MKYLKKGSNQVDSKFDYDDVKISSIQTEKMLHFFCVKKCKNVENYLLIMRFFTLSFITNSKKIRTP